LQESLYQRFIPDNNINEKLDLQKRNLLHQDGSATVAGVLMCSQNSDDYLYNSFIQAVCYNGVEKDANYQVDAQDFKGVLDQQIINAFEFVKQYNKVSATKEVGRTERPQYSMKAIF
jgi:predicted HTH transcriptional regulator